VATRQNVDRAVPMATDMVNAAIIALKGHLARTADVTVERRPGPGLLKHDGDPDLSEVGQGLLKYFNLRTSGPNYWTHIHGVLRTYVEIRAGLTNSNRYKLILATLNTAAGERGRVERYNREFQPLTGADAFRRRFGSFVASTYRYGFVDEYGHFKYYERYGLIGDINISVEWVCDRAALPAADAIARTIVHEASHKWAFTEDILYKHESFAKLPADNEEKIEHGHFQKKFELPMQKDIDGGGTIRSLMPMMGVEKDINDKIQPLTAERLLENADSYAWFARRMWKRVGAQDRNDLGHL
jgi:hypothetical protein